MTWYVTLDDDSYEAARESFEWEFPEGYDAVWNLIDKHENPHERVALHQAYPDGCRETYTFADLDAESSRMANALAERGVGFGDRVGIVLPQKPANPITHLACWKLGAISIPLSVLFGDDGLGYRLRNGGARVVVCDASMTGTVERVRADCPDLEYVIEVDGEDAPGTGARGEVEPYEAVLEGHSASHDRADVGAETPATIVYTSGSTGDPKGVLHTQGSWVGHCPGYQMYFERDIVGKSVVWTPADWAWLGALADALFTTWHYGRPVVGYPAQEFDPETAFSLVEEFGVTDTFLPPTAIRMMMDVEAPAERYDLELDAICSGGEALTSDILAWADEELEGVVVNEFYGQTEANMLCVNCQDWFEARPGSMGKVPPGREVAVVDSGTGEELPAGEIGEIVVDHTTDDPIVFEGYWGMPEETEGTRVGRWHLTGDLGYRDEDGYFWYKSRADDVIITSGYRVGPSEVEDAVLEHPAVAQAGVIGVPDETRGEVIKAFVELREGTEPSDALREKIRDVVRDRLAKYEYPREIEFVDELPRTTTGKIRRVALREREGLG